MCAELAAETNVRAALDRLADLVAQAEFRLPGPETSARQARRDELVWAIREYLIPRLGDLDAPLVAVLVGSTGAGKSTLINSIAQARISEPGAVRPTTRRPVIWCHERHRGRYAGEFLTGYSTEPNAVRSLALVPADHPLLETMTLIDAPDFDSVEEVHREIADELLAVADVCLFVTSAQRYADAVPWEFLRKAKARRLPMIYIMNRMPEDLAEAADNPVVNDYRRRLAAGGIIDDGVEIAHIREQSIEPATGGLSIDSVRSVVDRLHAMADEGQRRQVVVDAVVGAGRDVVDRARSVARDIEAEASQLAELRNVVDESYSAQVSEVARSLDGGTLIRGEVVRRWQEFVGTGELLKALTEGVGRLRAWAGRVLGMASAAEASVGREAEHELVTVIVRRADLAARAAAGAWELAPGGRDLLSNAGLWRHDEATPARASEAVEDWIIGLADLIEQQGDDKRKVARAASLGVNAAAVTLLLVVFSQTGGLTGSEFGIAAGAAAAQQSILEHVFGSAAARALVVTARTKLERSVAKVLELDARRFHHVLAGLSTGSSDEVAQTASQVEKLVEEWHGG